MRGTGAFTLLELTVALAVVAVATAVGLPRILANLPTYRVNAAARHLVADFRLAKTLAVERGVPVLVAFTPAAQGYRVAYDHDGDDRLTVPPDEVLKAVTVPLAYPGIGLAAYGAGTSPGGDPLPADGVSFFEDVARFSPSGGALAGAVYLTPTADQPSRSLRERGITVTVTTGRARVYRWTGTGWE